MNEPDKPQSWVTLEASPTSICIFGNQTNKPLLTITPKGEVKCEDVFLASQAGVVFINTILRELHTFRESMREELKQEIREELHTRDRDQNTNEETN